MDQPAPAAPPLPTVAYGLELIQIHGEDGGNLGAATFIGDLDGDGYDELAVVDGSDSEEYPDYEAASGLKIYHGPPHSLDVGRQGALYVFYGRPSFPKQLEASSADLILRGASGQIAKLGDVDGDGYDDFAFLEQCIDPRSGYPGGLAFTPCPTDGVNLVYGGPERLTGEYYAETVGARWTVGDSRQTYFSVRSAGDINGDRLADLLVEVALNDGSHDGNLPMAVLVIFGRSDRDAQFPAPGYSDELIKGSIGDPDAYGQSVALGARAAGDVDGDGYGDLLVRFEEGADFRVGSVRLFYGSTTPLKDQPFALITAGAVFHVYGRPVPLGDLDGDGLADFTLRHIGALLQSSIYDLDTVTKEASMADFFYGRAPRLEGDYSAQRANFSVNVQQGSDFDTGDMNGDGLMDLMLGTVTEVSDGLGHLDESASSSSLALLRGTGTRLSGEYELGSETILLSGLRYDMNSNFGTASAPSAVINGDANGDGFADLLVVTGGAKVPDGGYAYLVLGAPF